MSVVIAPPIRDALAAGKPLVALESTLICHGIPQPRNIQLAQEIEATVRSVGAVPATIAILDGEIKVGLDEAEMDRLARATAVRKCSTRDLAATLAAGADGATTVASTIFIAAAVGINIMATGGIGGVHRGGALSLDVSADLGELARTPVCVVCSGAKIILDLPRTLERLESLGIDVVGFGTDDFPAFYTPTSGLAIRSCADVAGLARLIEMHRKLKIPSGIVIANPPPADVALAYADVDALVTTALAEADKAGVIGPAATPFILNHMAVASGGKTVTVNEELVCANARLAAELAVELSSSSGDALLDVG